jgi:hypothetical protein
VLGFQKGYQEVLTVVNFGGRSIGTWSPGRPGRIWQDNIKIDLKDMDCEDVP